MLKSVTPLIALALSGGLWSTCPVIAAEPEKDHYQPEVFRYLTFLVGLGATPAPEVTEFSKDGAGTSTRYDWEGTRKTGYQGVATLMCGRTLGDGNGIQFGLDLAFATYDITPRGFTVGGAGYDNGSPGDLNYRTIGLNVVGGWSYGIRNREDLLTFITADVFLGGGLAFAENELHTTGGTYERANGTGGYYETGVKVGAYITEQRWIYGVNVTYTFGQGQVGMDFSGGYSSELDLDREGFGITGLMGYRF
jgi:hypothetical protein